MSRLFQAASALAVALTAVTAIAIGVPGMAQDRPGDVVFEPSAPAAMTGAAAPAEPVNATVASLREAIAAESAMVAGQSAVDDEHRCLAVGVYFESQGEPLEGQLAVAHVILNRVQSGRFATTACGVLSQRGQFSFVRNGIIPTPPNNQSWQTALAVARVALANSWRNPAPGAMYFHAARVSPGWNRPRVARLGQHIFYR